LAGVPSESEPASTAILAALLAAAAALRECESLADALPLTTRLATDLIPGAVAQALLYLRAEHSHGDPSLTTTDLLTLRAPARPPRGLKPPPLAALVEAARARAPRPWAGDTGAWLLAPLGRGVVGVLALQLAPGHSALDEQPYFLLAQLSAQALELAVLRGQAGRGAAEINMLDQVSAVVNSSLSLDEILAQCLAFLALLLPFNGGSIALVNRANELEIRTSWGTLDEEARTVRMPVGQGISGWVAETGKPYLSNDLDSERVVPPAARSAGTNRRISAYMAAPLSVEGRVIGILQVNSETKHIYTNHDLTLLAEVAERCAVAVERARLFSEMQARANRLASLAEIARRISAALDQDELFRICYEQVRKVMPAEAFFVALYEAATSTLRYAFLVDLDVTYPQRSEPAGSGLTSYVIRAREPLMIGDREQLPVTPEAFGEQAQLSQSVLIVPLIFEGAVLGAISAQSYTPHAYTAADLSLLITIANQTAVAVRNAQLYQSERAAQQAKDEFLSLVSHELRTPLTTVKGAAQVMQRRIVRAFSAGQVKTPEDQAARQQDLRQLASVVSQADRLNALVNDLLDLSRLQSGRFEFHPDTADLAAVLRQIVEACRPLSSNHRLVVDAPSAMPGTFDRLRVEQVLTNLIGNAIKYSPGDSDVRVRLALREPRVALVEVSDEGPGLSPEEQGHLFQQFYRGSAVRDNPRTGLGLGLYISRQIVEWHGGDIWVESAPGKGSSFQFTLPLERPPEESSGA
jgi:signal transduction histidine kinase